MTRQLRAVVVTALNAAAAAAIILACTFVLARSGESHSSSRLAHELPSPISQILKRMPVTLELLGASMILALIIGVGLAFIAARARGGIANRLLLGLALALRCTPFFWLALVFQQLVGIHIGIWIFGPAPSSHFYSTNYLAHLAVPACILALAQIPIVVQALDATDSLNSQNVSALFSTAIDALAVRLPEIIAACFITEIAFAWRGEGRLFFVAVNTDQPLLAIGVVLLAAVLTLSLRVTLRLASSNSPHNREIQDA
jgi:peptide/nickel transport system permease protein